MRFTVGNHTTEHKYSPTESVLKLPYVAVVGKILRMVSMAAVFFVAEADIVKR